MRPSSSARIACIASPESGFNRFAQNRAILIIISISVFIKPVLLKICRRAAHTMTTAEPIASLTITVFARHTEKCPKRTDPQWKRCDCTKSIYIRERGKTQYLSAHTRVWAEAERVAQAERDKRDPVKLELQKIEESEAVKRAAELSKVKPLEDAL